MGRNRSKWWPEAMDIIRQYPNYKKEIVLLDEEYAYASGVNSEVRVQNSNLSSGAADAAIRAMSDERREYMLKAVRGVDFAIAVAKTYENADIRLNYIKLRYWDNRYTHYGAAAQVFVHSNTAAKWNSEFIRCVAKRMGFI
jgi:hypothetical protein